ncbi:MAG TPA: 6-carboxytetrahydropterin synthase QueD [Firmicutes bacterium]|nr:6-carboxytetrahydropterin synthase QueD [Bacillota bacterium]
MYELMVKSDFASAHNLRDYKGKCERLHGHNYTVEAYFESRELRENGLAVDFTVLKAALNAVTEELDHKYLNEDVEFFKKNNTSAENIAKYIFDSLKDKTEPAKVVKVCVFESEKARACYYEKRSE